MAYCNIENNFLGKKLDKLFFEKNRNTLSNIIATEEFKQWFGKGKVDIDGNPLINEALSFTNEKGEKKTLFDYPIAFSNKAEIFKFLKNSVGIYLYNGELFINNTARDVTGNYASKIAMQTINVINYYYPNLLSVDIYQRSGLSPFSKGKSIPLPIIKINDKSIIKNPTLFSIYETSQVEVNRDRYSQIRAVDELVDLQNSLDEFRTYGLSSSHVEEINKKPEVSEDTYSRLISFFKKLSPNANVELIKNLSTAGAAYINEFLIQLDTDSKFKAMPEEVSHFFVEMLPSTSSLKKDMLSNITSFAIYGTTLATYRKEKDYQLENGQPNYDKIKREAAAKLVGEFVYAIAENDMSRMSILLKTNDSFIQKWWDRLVNWVKKAFSIDRKERFQSYIKAAEAILNEEVKWLSKEEIIRNAQDNVFLLNDRNKVDIAMAEHIIEKVSNVDKIDELQKIIDKFKRELGNNLVKITGQKAFEELNKELSKNISGEDTGINFLSELYDTIKKVDLTGKQTAILLSSENKISNFSKFIRVIQNMEVIAKSINTLVDTYKDDGKLESIAELQSFRNIYSNFQSFVDTDLADILAESDVQFEFIAKLRATANAFSTVEFKIINKLRESYKTFMKEALAPDNMRVLDMYLSDIEKSYLYRVQSDDMKKIIKTNMALLRNDIEEGLSIDKAKEKLISHLSAAYSPDGKLMYVKNGNDISVIKLSTGNIVDTITALPSGTIRIPGKIVNSTLISQLFDKLGNLYTTDRMVDDFMRGTGKDIDLTSSTSHMMTAAIKNHDSFVANIAKFIVNKRYQAQNEARIAIAAYTNKVSPLLAKLAAMGVDEYAAGEAITHIDKITDESLDEDGNLNYPEKIRDIVKLLSPVLNDVIIEKERLSSEKNRLFREWKDDKTNNTLKQQYKQARTDYINFDNEHFNSLFTEELTNFQKKWNVNDEFLDVKEEWDLLSEQIKTLLEIHLTNKNDDKAYVEYLVKKRERAELLKVEGKDAEHVKNAELLQQFFDESSKFREEDVIRTKRNYNAAYADYESKIDNALGIFERQNSRDLDTLEKILQDTLHDNTIRIKYKYKYIAMTENGFSEDSITSDREFEAIRSIMLDKFDTQNKVKVKTDFYYDYQKKIYEAIEILKNKQGISETDLIVADLYKQLNDLLIGKNDLYGQRNPISLSPAEKEKFRELENTLVSIKLYNVRSYKILDEVKNNKKYAKWLDDIKEYENLVSSTNDMLTGKIPADPIKLEDNKKNISAFNKLLETQGMITAEQKQISKDIKVLYGELSNMVYRRPTENYWEKIEDIIPVMEQLMSEKQLELDKATLRDVDRKLLQRDILNLSLLINGGNGNGGLMTAIYTQNHELLDKILNDEYLLDDGKTLVEFTRYVDMISSKLGMSMLEYSNPDFYDWFIEAHKADKVFINDIDPFTNEPLETGYYEDRKYVRRLYHIYSEPLLEETEGNKLYVVKESNRYRATRISDLYRKEQVSSKDTDNIEDWTVDNRVGRPQTLPLSRKQMLEQGKPVSKYINKKYYDLVDATDDKSQLLLQYLKESTSTYFEEQKSKPDELKSMFNLPVTNLDHYQSDKAWLTNLPDRAKHTGQKIAGFFTKSATDPEDQLTGIDQIEDNDELSQDRIDNKEKKAPRLGMNVKLPANRVNRNVLHAIQQYIIKSKDFDTRSDLNPFVKGLVDVLKANEQAGKRSQKKRNQIFDQIYKQMILEEMPDNISNKKFFRKTANALMSMTGIKLAADGLGGAINYLQANINNIIEAFAYKHLTPTDYAIGYGKATNMIGHLISDFNKKDNFSYWTLMYQTFDFIEGEFVEDISERSSVKGKLLNWRKMLMYPRKNGELHAQSASAIGMLNKHKVKNQIDGKMYPAWDIYKKVGDTLELKDGFWEYAKDDQGTDTTEKIFPWNTKDGKRFQEVKGLIKSVNQDLHGIYAKFNQTEASRHSIGKLMENMKRWFVSGLQRRIGRESIDVNKSSVDQGYYTTASLFFFNTIKELFKGNLSESKSYFNFYLNTPRKVENIKRFSTDIVIATALFLTTGMLGFGYDYDDPDKNKKLRESSWLYNEALLLFLRTYAEHTAYIPVPGFGFTELTRNLLDPFSVAKSALLNATGSLSTLAYTALYYLGMDSMENDTFYMRDSGAGKGPTLFNMDVPGQKGDMKFIKYLMNSFGYTGAQIDPANYIKIFEQLQNRLK